VWQKNLKVSTANIKTHEPETLPSHPLLGFPSGRFPTRLRTRHCISCENSGYHGPDCWDDSVLGCCALWSPRNWPTFQRLWPYMEVVSTSEMSVSFDEATSRNIPDIHLHCNISLSISCVLYDQPIVTFLQLNNTKWPRFFFGGLVVSVLVIWPKVRGFGPSRGRWISKAIKISSMSYFGVEVKLSVTCKFLRHVKEPLEVWRR
jgi:hypothetical protein